jgi:cytochrome c-type biogenesis protein CcmH
MKRVLLLAALLVFHFVTPAWAVDPDEKLQNPALELRAERLGDDLRCLVCQGESIEQSHADLARDIRVIVRQRIMEGQSNAQIKNYLVSRYGDFILLDPPFQLRTLVLWVGPFALLLGGLIGAGLYVRRRGRASEAPQPLTAEEKRRLEGVMRQGGA